MYDRLQRGLKGLQMRDQKIAVRKIALRKIASQQISSWIRVRVRVGGIFQGTIFPVP